jgi:hypothetical protein
LLRHRPKVANTVQRAEVGDRAIEHSFDKLQILDASHGSVYSTPAGYAHHTGRRINRRHGYSMSMQTSCILTGSAPEFQHVLTGCEYMSQMAPDRVPLGAADCRMRPDIVILCGQAVKHCGVHRLHLHFIKREA